VSVTRDSIAFDTHFFPFCLRANASPSWQTFHDLTQPQAAGARLQPAALPPPSPLEDDVSDESDFEFQKSIDDIPLESNMPKHDSSSSTSDEENEEATRNVRPTRNSAEHGEAKRRLTLTTCHKPRAPRQLTASDKK